MNVIDSKILATYKLYMYIPKRYHWFDCLISLIQISGIRKCNYLEISAIVFLNWWNIKFIFDIIGSIFYISRYLLMHVYQ